MTTHSKPPPKVDGLLIHHNRHHLTIGYSEAGLKELSIPSSSWPEHDMLGFMQLLSREVHVLNLDKWIYVVVQPGFNNPNVDFHLNCGCWEDYRFLVVVVGQPVSNSVHYCTLFFDKIGKKVIVSSKGDINETLLHRTINFYLKLGHQNYLIGSQTHWKQKKEWTMELRVHPVTTGTDSGAFALVCAYNHIREVYEYDDDIMTDPQGLHTTFQMPHWSIPDGVSMEEQRSKDVLAQPSPEWQMDIGNTECKTCRRPGIVACGMLCSMLLHAFAKGELATRDETGFFRPGCIHCVFHKEMAKSLDLYRRFAEFELTNAEVPGTEASAEGSESALVPEASVPETTVPQDLNPKRRKLASSSLADDDANLNHPDELEEDTIESSSQAPNLEDAISNASQEVSRLERQLFEAKMKKQFLMNETLSINSLFPIDQLSYFGSEKTGFYFYFGPLAFAAETKDKAVCLQQSLYRLFKVPESLSLSCPLCDLKAPSRVALVTHLSAFTCEPMACPQGGKLTEQNTVMPVHFLSTLQVNLLKVTPPYPHGRLDLLDVYSMPLRERTNRDLVDRRHKEREHFRTKGEAIKEGCNLWTLVHWKRSLIQKNLPREEYPKSFPFIVNCPFLLPLKKWPEEVLLYCQEMSVGDDNVRLAKPTATIKETAFL